MYNKSAKLQTLYILMYDMRAMLQQLLDMQQRASITMEDTAREVKELRTSSGGIVVWIGRIEENHEAYQAAQEKNATRVGKLEEEATATTATQDITVRGSTRLKER